MIEKKGKELATIKVFLNTGIIAALIGIGFFVSTVIFGILILIIK